MRVVRPSSPRFTAFTLLLLLLCLSGSVFSKPADGPIIMELRRVQVDPWITNKTVTENGSSSCFDPRKIDTEFVHDYNIQLPQQCKMDQTHVKIMNSCIFVTTAYQTDFYLDSADTDPFKMVVDLRSPWSWVKAPDCQQYNRDGTLIVNSSCSFTPKSTEKATQQTYNKHYDCSGTAPSTCKNVDNRCGEIDLTQEGLSLFGSFVSTKFVFKDKNFKKKQIKGFKMLTAHGLVGQAYLQGDGVLGLGLQHSASKPINEQPQNNNNNEDDNSEGNSLDDIDADLFGPTMTFYEPGTDLWSSIQRSYSSVNPKIFGLYLADHTTIKPQLLIGEKAVNATNLMHNPEKMALQWMKTPILKYDTEDELSRAYFHWNVPVSQIVFRYNFIKEKDPDTPTIERAVGYRDRTVVLLEKETEAQLSLLTSAIVLPEPMLVKVIDAINKIFDIECSFSTKYIKYVQCLNLKEPLSVSHLAVTIHIGYGKEDEIYLNVDPEALLLGCKKQGDTYSCFFNLQVGADERIILGDSALRNAYMVFDSENKRIGFAHAKSRFNDHSIWNELSVILGDVEDVIRSDIIFLLRFFLVIIMLSSVLFVFVNWSKIYSTIHRRLRYSSVIDPSANPELDYSTAIIKHHTDDDDIAGQIQELEQNESFDAL